MINLIVAYDRNRLIGDGDKLPWPPIKEDFKHFKETTLECSIVMGRKTWDSLPKKPLPKRHNFVMTRNGALIVPDNYEQVDKDGYMNLIVNNIDVILAMSAIHIKPVYVIGGAEIYKLFLDANLVDKIIASEIKGEYSGDVYFPPISQQEWSTQVVKEFADFNVVEYTKLNKE